MYYQEIAQRERWLADAVALRKQVANDTGSEARVDAFLQGPAEGGDAPQLLQLNEQIEGLTEDISTLRSDIEIEVADAEKRELTQARDSALETHQLLQQRLMEEQIASQTASIEVRIADRATVPTEPIGRSLFRNTALAAVMASVVAAGMVLVRAWWVMDDATESSAALDEQGRQRLDNEALSEEPMASPRAPDTLPS